MIAELGVDRLTMDALAERSGLGKGTVFRRFQPVLARAQTPMSQLHIRMLLKQMPLGPVDLDTLAVQLTAALDGPLLLQLSADLEAAGPEVEQRLAESWQDLVQRVCRP
jgi:hypothetical protein